MPREMEAIGFLQTNPKQKKQFKEKASINTERIFSTAGNYIPQNIESRTFLSIKF